MTQIHEFKCDSCKTKVKSIWNGEHYLPPHGWVELFDVNFARATGEHLCPKCTPKKPKRSKK